MTAYYNEIDPYAAAWLRNLIAAGHIAAGAVDERDIRDVRADDVRGYTQCHFFAGIGGWSYALRLAGWPDDRPVWTGSCPCQPFSAAGAGKAADDERHLWPAWFPLIAECRPTTVFGEQVEAAIGWGWLDAVFSDLEGEGYACGAAVLPACGVGAPHIRQRLWFVADATQQQHDVRRHAGPRWRLEFADGSDNGCMANSLSARLEIEREQPARDQRAAIERGVGAGELANADGRNASAERLQRSGKHGQRAQDGCASELGHAERAYERRQRSGDHSMVARRQTAQPQNWPADADHLDRPSSANPWSDCIWLPCRDGKARPTKPGIQPLAHGVSARMGKLRAAGNAIVPQVAAEFIVASWEAVTNA